MCTVMRSLTRKGVGLEGSEARKARGGLTNRPVFNSMGLDVGQAAGPWACPFPDRAATLYHPASSALQVPGSCCGPLSYPLHPASFATTMKAWLSCKGRVAAPSLSIPSFIHPRSMHSHVSAADTDPFSFLVPLPPRALQADLHTYGCAVGAGMVERVRGCRDGVLWVQGGV